jgi:cytochrome b pre-mRNA-processing protein 3
VLVINKTVTTRQIMVYVFFMISSLKTFFGFAKSDDATALYQAIVTAARNPALYSKFSLKDTTETRFELLTLHVFLVLHALRDRPETEKLRQNLFNTMVSDLDENLREMGVGDMSIGKKVKGLTEIFYGRVKQYKEALENNTLEEELSKVFATTNLSEYAIARLARLESAEVDSIPSILTNTQLS